MRNTILFLFVLIGGFVNAQDLHYSFYQYVPLSVNPANAGAFSGSYRVNGIYSDKQGALTPRNFRTFTLSGDSPIFRGIRKRDWIGVGLELSQFAPLNQSGLVTNTEGTSGGAAKEGFLSWTTFKVGLAYHLSIDKKQTRIVTVGAQMGSNNRSFLKLGPLDGRVTRATGLQDLDIQQFNQLIDDQSKGQTGGNTAKERLKNAFRDMTFGFLYNQRAKKSDLKVGFAIEGLTRPKLSINQNQGSGLSERKYIGLNIHGAYDMTINKRLHVVPGAYYYSLGPANGLNINTHANYLFNEEKEVTLSAGLGFRNLRAISPYLGADFKGVKVGFAYDIDISSAVVGSQSVGGFEVVASYIGKIYKKPKVKAAIFCPRL
jgi:type IX secretion system PorP/SprF family membrane protein